MTSPTEGDGSREPFRGRLRWWQVVAGLLIVVGFLYGANAWVQSLGTDPVGIVTTAVPSPVDCSDPPTRWASASSPSPMSIVPVQVRAGESAVVIVAAPANLPDAIMGVGLDWLCWNGSTWEMTHKLFTDDVPAGAQTLEHPPPPGVTTTIIDLPVSLPSASGIVIPDVVPGTYRLQTGNPVGGATPFVVLEVIP